MDKIMSARVDEAVARQIGMLAKKLKITRKAVIENAIRVYSNTIEAEHDVDPLTHAFGCWKREEPPEETVKRVRGEFRKSQERFKR